MSPWTYRPALDGLRTLAVYLVLLFHVGVGSFAGGFVGVDLFFVLSGFLVSTILFEELERTGRLDLARFYDRRVRRLLPAAVLLVVAASGVALVVLTTVRRDPLVGDAQAALLYVANWRFLLQKNDYFGAGDVDSSLFLHFWSLSIEEQFYFVFPLLLIVLWRLERRRRGVLVGVLGLLFAGSLVAQVLWARVDVNHAYYGTEARLYQLLAGALLAVAFRRVRDTSAVRLTSAARTAIAFGSLAGMVLTASSAVDFSPSQRGLLATVFAVGLIASLAGEHGGAAVGVFSLPPLVYLGKISYGIYLWHWPVIVLLDELVRPPTLLRAVLVAGMSTMFAAASYHMLERPIRAPRLRPVFQIPAVATGLSASVVAALLVVPPVLQHERKPDLVAQGTAGALPATGPTGPTGGDGGGEAGAGGDDGQDAAAQQVTDGPVPDIDLVAVRDDHGADPRRCTPDAVDDCAIVTGQPGPHVVLVGDSYGQMLAPTLTRLAKEHGFNLSASIISGCPWLRGVVKAANTADQQKHCADARESLYTEQLDAMDADLVVLIQRSRDDSVDADMTRPPGDDGSNQPLTGLLADSTRRTLDGLDELGIPALVVHGVYSPVESYGDPLDCLAKARRTSQCRVPVSPLDGVLDALYRTESAENPDVADLDLNPIVCPTAPICEPIYKGVPVWRDRLHYTPRVLLKHRDEIWRAIEDTGLLADSAA
ncbi:MAG: acyltransferase family protein [Nocardioides sp.]